MTTVEQINQPTQSKALLYVRMITTWMFSILFIVFGANKLVSFLDLGLPADPLAKTFLVTMFTTYLVKLVGFFQVTGAVLLLIPRTRFIGTLLFLPIILNIDVFHLVHDNPGNGLWIFITILFAIILESQQKNFLTLFKIQG